ncbi:MAG: nuclear transport factor 2 family protein [Carboxylicivirga sp.]|jgi:ketosteroid isomerase-like protein|nr:nuclear transport factor 2 family protein [Carboxylicivirga sp.]
MKKGNGLKQFLLLGLLFGMVLPMLAQEMYLPATTRSKEAKALYKQAMDAVYDVEFIRMEKINKQALAADPNLFMGLFLQSFSNDKSRRDEAIGKMASYSGKMNKGEKVLQQWAIKMKDDPKYDGIAEGRQLVKMYPKNIFAKTMLAYNLGAKDETRQEAMDVLNQCIQLKPDLASVYNSLGYLHLSQDEFEKAEQAFDKYISMASDKPNPYDSKGDYYMAVKAYKDAAMQYKKAYEMNGDFSFSKVKYKDAKWMAKREKIAMKVKKHCDQLVADYNSRDMSKYTKHYMNAPDFCFVVNGDAVNSYYEFVKRVNKSHEMFIDWKVDILKETIEVPSENIATVTQIFAYKGTPKEGEKLEMKGSFTTVWRKEKDTWKVVHAINTNPIAE